MGKPFCIRQNETGLLDGWHYGLKDLFGIPVVTPEDMLAYWAEALPQYTYSIVYDAPHHLTDEMMINRSQEYERMLRESLRGH